MLPKLAWGARTDYTQRPTGRRAAPRAGTGRYSTAEGMRKNKSIRSPCIFQGCFGKIAGNLLCSSCRAAAPRYRIAPATQLVDIQGARRWHSRMRSYIAWVCQPNKADDVSLWLLLYQLITLGKLWSGFCPLLALGLLIRYSSFVL